MKYNIIYLLITLFSIQLLAQDLDHKTYSPKLWKEKRIFKKIGKAVANKRIVILGEAAHNEGKTFEYKTKLINHLVEKEGFNIVALEGGGYFDFKYLNQELKPDTNIQASYFTAWYGFWSYAEQNKDLITSFKEGKVKGFGMECQPTGLTVKLIPYCKNLMNADEAYNWANLESTAFRTITMDTTLTNKELTLLESEIVKIKHALANNSTICNALDNYIAYLNQFKAGFTTYEGQNKGINIRDKQMAKNIIKHLNENPDDKIIIWTANFHGAKQIKEIEYGDKEDPLLYNRLNLLGEHLFREYKNAVFSLAFASNGTVGSWMYDTSDTIPQYSGNFEHTLFQEKNAIGFVDFTRESNKEQVFYSSLLGHSNKRGKWMKAFDGVFYIRENEKVYKRN